MKYKNEWILGSKFPVVLERISGRVNPGPGRPVERGAAHGSPGRRSSRRSSARRPPWRSWSRLERCSSVFYRAPQPDANTAMLQSQNSKWRILKYTSMRDQIHLESSLCEHFSHSKSFNVINYMYLSFIQRRSYILLRWNSQNDILNVQMRMLSNVNQDALNSRFAEQLIAQVYVPSARSVHEISRTCSPPVGLWMCSSKVQKSF